MAQHKIAKISDIPEGQGKTFTVEGQEVAVFNKGGQQTTPAYTKEDLQAKEVWKTKRSPALCTGGNITSPMVNALRTLRQN